MWTEQNNDYAILALLTLHTQNGGESEWGDFPTLCYISGPMLKNAYIFCRKKNMEFAKFSELPT